MRLYVVGSVVLKLVYGVLQDRLKQESVPQADVGGSPRDINLKTGILSDWSYCHS